MRVPSSKDIFAAKFCKCLKVTVTALTSGTSLKDSFFFVMENCMGEKSPIYGYPTLITENDV